MAIPDAMVGGETAAERWRKRLALVACIMASGIVGVDGTMSGVDLPAIANGLNAGLGVQQWVIASYSLALGGLMLVGGALGDIYDRWRIFGIGVAGFGVAALSCTLAPNATVLIVARAAQGAFVALIISSTLAVITNTFEGGERAKVIGSLTAWGGISMMIGPLLGGALVTALSWRAVFAVSVPLAAVAFLLIVRLAPSETDHPKHGTLDVLGAVLGVLAVGGPVFAFIQQATLGWGDPLVKGAMVVGNCALVGFFFQERRARNPFLPLIRAGSLSVARFPFGGPAASLPRGDPWLRARVAAPNPMLLPVGTGPEHHPNRTVSIVRVLTWSHSASGELGSHPGRFVTRSAFS